MNAFYHFTHKSWLIESKESLWHLFFYALPKFFYGAIIGILFLSSLFAQQGRRYFVIASALVIAPILVALLKPLLGHECPKDLLFYAGAQPHLSWLSAVQTGTGRCFPGGHVSAGFGLYSLVHLLAQRYRALFVGFVTVWGSLMGIYQLARGYHFLSHNLATLLLCYVLAWAVGILLDRLNERAARPLFG